MAVRRSKVDQTNKHITTDPTSVEWKRMVQILRNPSRCSADFRNRMAKKLFDYVQTNGLLSGNQPGVR